MTEETKKKISESMKGNKNRVGCHFSEQALQNRSKINKGKKIYNNGVRNIFLRIGQVIPEGFVEGVFVAEEDRERRHKQMCELNEKKWSAWRQEHGKQS